MYSLLKYFSRLTVQFWDFAKVYWIDCGIIFTLISIVVGAYFLVSIDKTKCIDSRTGVFSQLLYEKRQEDTLCAVLLSNVLGWCIPAIIVVIGWLGLLVAPIAIGGGTGQLVKWMKVKRNRVTLPTATARECK